MSVLVLVCCCSFDADFRFELFYQPLPGLVGTGPALAAARTAAGRQADATGGSPSASGAAVAGWAARPLGPDREAYQRSAQALAALGKAPPSFDSWLLGRVAAAGSDADRGSSEYGQPEASAPDYQGPPPATSPATLTLASVPVDEGKSRLLTSGTPKSSTASCIVTLLSSLLPHDLNLLLASAAVAVLHYTQLPLCSLCIPQKILRLCAALARSSNSFQGSNFGSNHA